MASQHKTLLCQYHYDPLDQLTGHPQSESLELQRFYCKTRMATEIQGTTRRSIFQHGDLLLAQQQRQGEARDATLLATDQQRSVLQTLKANNQPHPIAYSPYGHRPSGSGLTSLLGFNGERPDPVTGHYLLGNGYRAFNPVLMRFNSPDSLSPFGKGGINAYVYCMGDPINLQDPNGHIPSILKFLKTKFGKRPSPATQPPTTPATSTSTSQLFSNPIIERSRSASLPSLPTQPRNDAKLYFARGKTDIYGVDRNFLNVEKIDQLKVDIKELEFNVIPKNRLLEERYLHETKAYNAAYRDLSERAIRRGDKYEVAPPSYESVQRQHELYTLRDWTSMQQKELSTLKQQLDALRNG